VPRYSVALVQSEMEMLQTPGNELSAFLLASPERWRAEVFTERTFEAALRSAERFDCVVLGFNAVYQSEAIQRALASGLPATGVLVLHQLQQKGVAFLPPDLALGLSKITGSVGEAVAHKHTDPDDEILLNWPERVAAAGSASVSPVAGSAICRLDVPSAGAWRTSLEVVLDGERAPVVLRTSSLRRPRIVVCTLLLEPRKLHHASLLRNMITYCAAGWPEIAVVEDLGGGGRGREIARKLRVQGTNVVELPLAAPGPLRFREWPLRGVHEVVVDEQWDVDTMLASEGAQKWLELGNTLVRLEGDRLTLRHGASDAHVVAQRWATCFHAVDPVRWHGGADGEGGSIFATRAVLRVLALLQRERTRVQPDRLGLEAPSYYAKPAIALLTRRWRDSRFEGTISTHAAALDVLQLVGGVEQAGELAEYLTDWLRSAFADAAPEDRFDIARCLGHPELFEEAVAQLPNAPLPAVLATRLREAAVACGVRPRLEASQRDEVPSTDLESNLLLAGEYIAARVAFAQAFKRHSWSRLDDAAMNRALSAVAKFGLLARAPSDGGPFEPTLRPSGEISTEARGLIEYYNLDPSSTHAIRRGAQGVPPGMVEAVLKTSNKARVAEAAAQASERARERELRRAKNVFGVATAAAAGALFGWMITVLGHDLPGITAAFGLGALLFVALSLVLHLFGLVPDWTKQAAETVAGGFSGLGTALTKRFRTEDERG
jgi:hypothetical protein